MSFKDKLEAEYEQKGVFSFLERNMLGESKHTHNIIIEGPELISIEYVLDHPNTDLEKYYLKEIINILIQKEIEIIIPTLKEIETPVEDIKENIIFTNKKNKYKNAKTFYCSIKKDFCIPRNKIYIKNYLPSIILTENKIASAVRINTNVDREPTTEELENEAKAEQAQKEILNMYLKN